MKRFRFSLLSLVVGVVLAGGVVWLNLRPRADWVECSHGGIEQEHSYGWPFKARYRFVWPHEPDSYGWLWKGLAVNIAIGLAIVFGGAGVCEWLVRRRAAKAKE